MAFVLAKPKPMRRRRYRSVPLGKRFVLRQRPYIGMGDELWRAAGMPCMVLVFHDPDEDRWRIERAHRMKIAHRFPDDALKMESRNEQHAFCCQPLWLAAHSAGMPRWEPDVVENGLIEFSFPTEHEEMTLDDFADEFGLLLKTRKREELPVGNPERFEAWFGNAWLIGEHYARVEIVGRGPTKRLARFDLAAKLPAGRFLARKDIQGYTRIRVPVFVEESGD